MSTNKKVLVRDTAVTNRTFKYSKNDSNLSFTCRTDVKQHLKDFLELLDAAADDVQKEIDKK